MNLFSPEVPPISPGSDFICPPENESLGQSPGPRRGPGGGGHLCPAPRPLSGPARRTSVTLHSRSAGWTPVRGPTSLDFGGTPPPLATGPAREGTHVIGTGRPKSGSGPTRSPAGHPRRYSRRILPSSPLPVCPVPPSNPCGSSLLSSHFSCDTPPPVDGSTSKTSDRSGTTHGVTSSQDHGGTIGNPCIVGERVLLSPRVSQLLSHFRRLRTSHVGPGRGRVRRGRRKDHKPLCTLVSYGTSPPKRTATGSSPRRHPDYPGPGGRRLPRTQAVSTTGTEGPRSDWTSVCAGPVGRRTCGGRTWS